MVHGGTPSGSLTYAPTADEVCPGAPRYAKFHDAWHIVLKIIKLYAMTTCDERFTRYAKIHVYAGALKRGVVRAPVPTFKA